MLLIVITAPLGAITITFSSTRLLEAEDHAMVERDPEKDFEDNSLRESGEFDGDDISVIRTANQILNSRDFNGAFSPNVERMKMIDEPGSDIFLPRK